MTNSTTVQDIVYALTASPDFAQDGICFAARDSGPYRSDDGGIGPFFCFHKFSYTQVISYHQ